MSSMGVLTIGGIACVALLAPPAARLLETEQSVRQVATLRTARAAHTATTLATGQVLVVGGMADGGGSVIITIIE